MPVKKSNTEKRQTSKAKPSARQRASDKMQRSGTAGERPKLAAGNKKISQSRFPGERPLTGEDRPASRSGGKKHAPNRK